MNQLIALLVKSLKPCILLCLCLSPLSFAGKPIITLVTEHFPPYQIVNSDYQITGYAIDLVKETFKRSGYQMNLSSYSWARTYQLAQKNTNTCIFSLTHSTSREHLFKWVGELSPNKRALWGVKGKPPSKLDSLEEAKKYTIAVMRNYASHLSLVEQGFKEGENLYLLDDPNSMFKLLMSEKGIDMILINDIALFHQAIQSGVNPDNISKLWVIKDQQQGLYLACSLTTNDLIIADLRRALNSLYQDGFHEKTKLKWLGKAINK